jgi:membrane protease subunit (stomatin/prohibitin family)
VGIWFYRKADINNIRWGTRIPIKYNDPVYAFPVHLRGYGNYSIKIVDVKSFFVSILAGQEDYFSYELQELFLSRITQPISNYLANAKFSYAEIDSHIEEIAKETQLKSLSVFEDLGFSLIDFRIEGTSFDEETNQRINEISNVQADVHASKIAGVDYAQMQQLKAMRDLAKNEGTAGASMGMFAGMSIAQNINPASSNPDLKTKLKELKELFDEGLIDEQEFKEAKAKLLP